VYAVELPGHDVGATSEPFAPLAQVVDLVAEINRRGLTTVLLWGHSSGAAPSPSRRPGGCSGLQRARRAGRGTADHIAYVASASTPIQNRGGARHRPACRLIHMSSGSPDRAANPTPT
jgi:surfactin synthase thioesterase subunit